MASCRRWLAGLTTSCCVPQVARGASAQGSMGGLTWFATQTSGASTYCYSTSATTFNYETFDDACLAKFNQGGFENANWVMIMPPTGAQVIPYIHESAMRMDYAKENVRGYFANSLMTTINGARIPVVVSCFPAERQLPALEPRRREDSLPPGPCAQGLQQASRRKHGRLRGSALDQRTDHGVPAPAGELLLPHGNHLHAA